MKFYFITLLAILLLLILSGCGSSTASRYDEEKEKKEEIETEDITKDDSALPPFNMIPYHSRFEFNVKSTEYEGDIWYGYDSSQSQVEINLIDTTGYRVEVMATDDLEEANNMRSELNFRIRQSVYIIFDPPFYRVRTGDFENRSAAENQSFKLRQLGYQDSRVVSDTIKLPEKP
jgi:hypothetical protein